MILTAHQPQYLPGLRLLHKIACADKFIIFDIVQFERHSFENRNRIKTADGPHWLTVPVEMKGHIERRSSPRVVRGNWQRKHLRAIELAYRKAPFFGRYFDGLREAMSLPHLFLHDLNYSLLVKILEWFGIKTPVEHASLAQWAHGEFQGVKSELVLDMCRKEGATTYIFGAQGRGYADVAAFEAAGVRPVFQDYKYPSYRQQHGDFLPDMSAIDLLFNEGPDSYAILMRGNASSDDYR